MENTKPIISVIIPVYNAEEYLEKCLTAVISQTYDNLDIILVNDGSKDNSLQICMDYMNKDQRIRVINQENAGPSAARNKGLEYAKGKYIGFVDSDDMISEKMYEILLTNLIENEAQMSIVGMEYHYLSGEKKPYFDGAKKHIISKDDVNSVFLKNTIITYAPVDKLYSREAIGEIRFDTKIKMCEDQKFVYQVLKNVNKVIYDPTICYSISCTEGSLSRAIPTRYHMSMLDVNEYIIADVSEKNIKEMAILNNVNCCLSYFVLHYDNGQFSKEDKVRIDKIVKDGAILGFKKGNMNMRIKLLLYFISVRLLRYVFNMIRNP